MQLTVIQQRRGAAPCRRAPPWSTVEARCGARGGRQSARSAAPCMRLAGCTRCCPKLDHPASPLPSFSACSQALPEASPLAGAWSRPASGPARRHNAPACWCCSAGAAAGRRLRRGRSHSDRRRGGGSGSRPTDVGSAPGVCLRVHAVYGLAIADGSAQLPQDERRAHHQVRGAAAERRRWRCGRVLPACHAALHPPPPSRLLLFRAAAGS